MNSNRPVEWHKVAEPDELSDGRVKTIVVGRRSLALTRYQGRYGCLDNHCPHQGGPLATLSECLPEDAVICVDVGNNTYSFGRYFESRHQSVLMSGYLGSIGFGFPAAMGAWAAVGDDRAVISISGDGGFGQYAMELTTAVQYGMNITHVLLNNSELAKITKEQTSASYDVWKTALHNPSFAAFAELCGARGIEVTEPGQLAPAVAEALAYPGPSLVEVIADPLLV